MSVRVYTPINNPFADIHHRVEWDYCDWPAGMTLPEMFPDASITASTSAGEVPYHLIPYIRWRDSVVLHVRPVSQASVAIGSAIAGSMAGWSAAGAFTIGTAAAIGAGVAALNLGTTLLTQSKLDNKGQLEGADDRDNSITGISNQVARFEPIPRVLGRMRFYPPIPMTAQSYTEIDGDDEYLRSYFILGYGPLNIGGKVVGGDNDKITEADELETTDDLDQAPIRIAETDIHEYDDIQFEIGRPDQISLYSDQIIQEDIGWTTDGREDDGESAVRTTAPNITEFSLDIGGPLYSHKSSKGQLRFATVHYEVAWRKTGSDDDWETHTFYIQGKGNMVRSGTHITGLEPGQYDVRLKRLETDYKHDNATKSEITWNALRSIRDRRPFDVKDTVVMAIRVRGTDQLNGQIDQLNVLATSVLPVYDEDEGEWEHKTSRNPAWAFASVLTDRANYRPSDLDILYAPSFAEWAKACDDKGICYDNVLDNDTNTLDRLNGIADCGYATWSIDSDTRIRAVLDVISKTPHDLITPRNSWDYSTTLKAFDPPDALRVRYTDTESWKKTERLVFWNGFDRDNAKVYQSIDAPGCTSSEQAWIYGRRYLGNMRLRAIQKHTYKTNFRHFDYAVGDTVHIAHDTIMVGTAWGRVTGYETDGDNVASVTADEFLDMPESDKDYGMQIQNLSGDVKTVKVKNNSPGANTVELDEELDSKYIEHDALIAFGEIDKITTPVKVVAIRPEDQDTAEIECEPAAPELEGVADGDIPAPANDITVMPDPANAEPGVPVISRVLSDESVAHENDDGSLAWRLRVYVAPSSGNARTRRINVQIRQAADEDGELDEPTRWRQRTADSGEVEFDDVWPGDVVEIRAESEADNGRSSKWSDTTEHEISGRTPDKPTSVDVERGTFQIKLIPHGGTPATEFEFWRGEPGLEHDDIEDAATYLGRGGSYEDGGLTPDTKYGYYVRAVNAYGVSGWYALRVKTKNEPDAVLKNLSNQISSTELADELEKEIEKISGDGDGSVTDRLKEEAKKRADEIKQEADDRDEAIENLAKEQADALRDEASDILDKLEKTEAGLSDDFKDRLQALRDQIDGLASQFGDIIGTPEWDKDQDYDDGDLVIYDGHLYRARKDVPDGTSIDDGDYWQQVGDYKSIGEQLSATVANLDDLKSRVKETEDGVEALNEDTKTLQSRTNALRLEGRYGFETGVAGQRGAPTGWDLDADKTNKVGYVKAWEGSDYGSRLAYGAKSGSPGAWSLSKVYSLRQSGGKFRAKARTKVINGHAYTMLVAYDATGEELKTEVSDEKSTDHDDDIEVSMKTPDGTRFIELYLRASKIEED